MLTDKTSAELRVKSSKTATNTESHETGREKKYCKNSDVSYREDG